MPRECLGPPSCRVPRDGYLRMAAWLTVFFLMAPSGVACDATPAVVEAIQDERIRGSLNAAESAARALLECPDLDDGIELDVHIELARILDRQGLHSNTRPVEGVLEILGRAASKVKDGDLQAKAKLDYALATYFYRAETVAQSLETATRHAERALEGFRESSDVNGEADAIHLLGLIALQSGRLQEARECFDRSLEISREAPERLIFLSDYERHVALVDLRSGDRTSAIQHPRRYLEMRDRAESRDYGMFARTLLASVLIDEGEVDEAVPLLLEALEFSDRLPSPVGEMRATYQLARANEMSGKTAEAMTAYQRTLALATEVRSAGMQKAAEEAVARCSDTLARDGDS